MKSMKELMGNMSITAIEARSETINKNANEKSAEVINELFAMLKSIFPAYKQAWPTATEENQAKKEWLSAFIAENISDSNRIRHAIRKCRLSTSPFLPSLGQFLDWCNPTMEDLGLPDVNRAYDEAYKNSSPCGDRNWTHEIIYHTFVLVSAFRLYREPRQKIFPEFRRHYEATVKKFLAGEKLYQVPKAMLEFDDEVNKNIEVGKEHLLKIRGMLIG